MKRGLGVSHSSQGWGGKGLGRLKMKHEKGFGRFMVPKRGSQEWWEGWKLLLLGIPLVDESDGFGT